MTQCNKCYDEFGTKKLLEQHYYDEHRRYAIYGSLYKIGDLNEYLK